MAIGLVGYSSNGTGWNKLTQSVYDRIDESEARVRHERGDTYTAVLADNDTIVTVAQIAEFGMNVAFYDRARSKVLELRDFRGVGGRLWLWGINRYNGGASLPKPERVAEWFSWPDTENEAVWRRFDADHPQGKVVEERTDWDRDPHWFDRPPFAQYGEFVAPGLLEQMWPGVAPLPLLAP